MLLTATGKSALLGGGVQGWAHPGSALALDLKGGRFALNRRARSGGLISCTRSSTHLLQDAGGVWQSFAANELARIDGVGAYIGGQVTNAWAKPDDFTNDGVNWSTGAAVSFNGDFGTLTDSSNTLTQQALALGSIAADGNTYTLWADAKKDAENTIIRSLFFRLYGGTVKGRQINLNTSTGAYFALTGNGTYAVYDLGDRWRVVVNLTNNGTNNVANVYLNPCFNTLISATSPDATLTGAASFAWPHALLGNYPGGRMRVKGTRYASDVRAADLTWFSAAGLGAGACELVIPNWSATGLAANRPLFEYSDGTAANSIKGFIDASDKPTLQIVAGGVTQTTTALPSSIATGRKPLVFGWGAAGGYVGDAAGNVATFGAVTIPAVTQKRIGGSVAGNFMNDVIEQMQACRPIAQADALNWAAAA